MKTTIVFDHGITGHHLEYLNHLYRRAGEKPDEKYVFVVHHKFHEFEDYLTWSEYSNIEICILDKMQVKRIEGNKLISSFRKSRLLKTYVKEKRASHVFLISLMQFLPFLPLLLMRQVKISGIIYSIAARSYHHDGIMKRIQDFLKYFILSRFKCFEHIFILNDPASARLLNKKLKCSVFCYLPDPLMQVKSANSADTIQKLNLTSGDKIFLHFGNLETRKGTLDILDSIELIKSSDLNHVCFIFAGNLNSDIANRFNERIKLISAKVRIRVFEGFCSYELLGKLCSVSDYLLLPYRSGSNSSGLLGYAAQFNIPVIATSDGLIGSLIGSYKLGYTYDLRDPLILSSVLEKHIKMPSVRIDGSKYLADNTIVRFQRMVFE